MFPSYVFEIFFTHHSRNINYLIFQIEHHTENLFVAMSLYCNNIEVLYRIMSIYLMSELYKKEVVTFCNTLSSGKLCTSNMTRITIVILRTEAHIFKYVCSVVVALI